MIFIQLSEKYGPKGFLILAKSGSPIVRMPNNTYGVQQKHLKLLTSKKIPFKKLPPDSVPLPEVSLSA